MDEVRQKDKKLKLYENLKVEMKTQTSLLMNKKQNYSELTEEDKKIVDKYVGLIDLKQIHTIYEFGKEETDLIFRELDILIGMVKNHNRKILDLYRDLLSYLNGDSNLTNNKLEMLLKKFHLNILIDVSKKIDSKRYANMENQLQNDIIQEKLESIRSELLINIAKLETIAQNSVEQYIKIQYQIIALQKILEEIQQRKKETYSQAEGFFKSDINFQLDVEEKIKRKIKVWKVVASNVSNKLLISKLLIYNNKGLIENNELSELEIGTNDYLINRINEVLRAESEFTEEMIGEFSGILAEIRANITQYGDMNIEEDYR